MTDSLREGLEASGAHAIVVSAYWAAYESGDYSHLRTEAGQSINEGLLQTVNEIQSAGIPVFVLGPLPKYDQDLPLILALAAKRGKPPHALQTKDEHREKHVGFFAAAASLEPESFFDPSTWLCSPTCELLDERGLSLYRDSNHLSVAGALRLHAQVEEMLDRVSKRAAGYRGTARAVAVEPVR